MAKSWACRAFYNVNPFIGLSFHESMLTIPLPPFMVPTVLPHIDFSVMQGLWLGSYVSLGNGKKIEGDGLLFLAARSDAGFPIPHISIPPSWFNLLTSLFASSVELFGASSVQIGSKNLLWGDWDTAIAATPFGPVPFGLELACNEMPCCFLLDLSVLWGSVYVGMSLTDLFTGLAYMALYIALDFGGKALGKVLGGGIKKIGTMFARTLAEDAAEDGAKMVSEDAAKDYLAKAARLQGIRDALSMSDEDLGKFAEDAGSDDLAGVARHLDEGVEQADSVMAKKLEGVDAGEIAGEATKEMQDLRSSVGRWAFADAKQEVLEGALDDSSSAVTSMRRTIAAKTVAYGLAFGTLTTAAAHIISYESVFTGGSQGGLFSFGSIDLPDLVKKGADDVGDFASSVGRSVDDYWFTATDSVAHTADDYWYDAT